MHNIIQLNYYYKLQDCSILINDNHSNIARRCAVKDDIKNQIIQALEDNQIELVRKVLFSPGIFQNESYVEILIDYLNQTLNNDLRNDIAILLSDVGCEKAVKTIIALLHSEKTIGNRGTLLYSLEELEYFAYLEDLFPFLFDNSFEVRMQTYRLFEKAARKFSNEDKAKFQSMLSDILLQTKNISKLLR